MKTTRYFLSFSLMLTLLFGTYSCQGGNDQGATAGDAKQQVVEEPSQNQDEPVTLSAKDGSTQTPAVKSGSEGTKIIKVTTAEFKQMIFDYEKNTEWKYTGQLPAIVDFYADWCGPCKMIAPILEELQQEYKGKIQVYKVNVDNERELAQVFQTQSIPSLLFIPMEGQPQMAKGALPKTSFEDAIKNVLKVTK